MKKAVKYSLSMLGGVAYAALAVLLSGWLIRNLSSLFAVVSGMTGSDEDTLIYISQILSQFRQAEVVPPWLWALLTGAAFGTLTAWLSSLRRVRRIAIDILLWLPLLIPLSLIVLWFTDVNGIRVGALVSRLFPLLPDLL